MFHFHKFYQNLKTQEWLLLIHCFYNRCHNKISIYLLKPQDMQYFYLQALFQKSGFDLWKAQWLNRFQIFLKNLLLYFHIKLCKIGFKRVRIMS